MYETAASTHFIREPEQIGVGVLCEHAVDGIHQLFQKEQEELLGDSSSVYCFLSVKDDLRPSVTSMPS